MIEFVEDDTGTKAIVTCLDATRAADGSRVPIDLTGIVVKLKYKIAKLDGTSTALVTRTMTNLAPATDGKAEYAFVTGELKAGKMTGEYSINYPGGNEITSLQTFALEIRPRLS